MTAPRPGFRQFGDTDDDLIVQEAFTSDSGSFTEVVESGFSHTYEYTDEGILLGEHGTLELTALTAVQKDALAIAGTLTMWIGDGVGITDSGYVGGSYNEFIFSLLNATLGIYIGSGGISIKGNVIPLNNSTIATKLLANGLINRWEFTWVGGLMTIRLNYFAIATQAVKYTAANWDKLYLGRNIGRDSIRARRKNLMLSTQPIVLPVPAQLISVCSFGDSRDTGGAYANVNMLITDTAGGGTGDVRTCTALHRKINEYGFDVGLTQIKTFGVDSSTIDSVTLAQIPTALSEGQHHIQTAIIHTGLNDVLAQTITSAEKTDLQNIVDDLKVKGCDLIFMVNCTNPTSNPTSYPSATDSAIYDPLINQLNTYFDEIEAANSEVVVIDFWSRTGGNTPNPDYFTNGDNIHPSDKGYNELGGMIFDEMKLYL